MNRWTGASLLAATVLLTACASDWLRGDEATKAMACTIGSAKPTPDGIRLLFRKDRNWNFVDSAGRQGLIGNGQVVELINGPDGIPNHEFPPTPYLDLKLGQTLRLTADHVECMVGLVRKRREAVLRIWGRCPRAIPCTDEAQRDL
jgi:hypothetical protein